MIAASKGESDGFFYITHIQAEGSGLRALGAGTEPKCFIIFEF